MIYKSKKRLYFQMNNVLIYDNTKNSDLGSSVL